MCTINATNSNTSANRLHTRLASPPLKPMHRCMQCMLYPGMPPHPLSTRLGRQKPLVAAIKASRPPLVHVGSPQSGMMVKTHIIKDSKWNERPWHWNGDQDSMSITLGIILLVEDLPATTNTDFKCDGNNAAYYPAAAHQDAEQSRQRLASHRVMLRTKSR